MSAVPDQNIAGSGSAISTVGVTLFYGATVEPNATHLKVHCRHWAWLRADGGHNAVMCTSTSRSNGMLVRFAPDTRQWTAGDTTSSASRTQQTDAEERAMAAETGVCSLQTPAEDLAASFEGRDSRTTVPRKYLRR